LKPKGPKKIFIQFDAVQSRTERLDTPSGDLIVEAVFLQHLARAEEKAPM
jgi:hypothetical protein